MAGDLWCTVGDRSVARESFNTIVIICFREAEVEAARTAAVDPTSSAFSPESSAAAVEEYVRLTLVSRCMYIVML